MSNRKNYSVYMIFFIFLVLLIPILIFGLVNTFGGSEFAKKGELLSYYGTIIGACFTGYITALGLFYTLKQNAETFNDQRNIDKGNREEEKINSVMPVFKIGIDFRTGANMWFKTNHQFNGTSTSDHLLFYIKNIGVGPALDIRIKIGDDYINNLYNVSTVFDSGVSELISIDVKTKFDEIEKTINGNKHIDMQLEFKDVYNKRIYKYFVELIKTSNSSLYETVIIKDKQIIPIVQ
ncbi:hypothetical protein [Clostridium sp. C2-6-12]|uniref:hypothetical protein n=1 Tax=Clostridium sp. C2-6-12 TaxID=2698832 RepID=UPI00136F727E|nr:hypothetical protein [Clostridium sp. C2-6-12]